MTYGTDRMVVPVTIPAGTALSNEVNVADKRIVGIIMPAAWTAANLSFKALTSEPSALPKVPVYGEVVDNAGSAVSVTAAAAVYIALADTFPGEAWGRIIVRSGTSGVPVNQGADRTLGLVCVAP
jgi:hypothetical protein